MKYFTKKNEKNMVLKYPGNPILSLEYHDLQYTGLIYQALRYLKVKCIMIQTFRDKKTIFIYTVVPGSQDRGYNRFSEHKTIVLTGYSASKTPIYKTGLIML